MRALTLKRPMIKNDILRSHENGSVEIKSKNAQERDDRQKIEPRVFIYSVYLLDRLSGGRLDAPRVPTSCLIDVLSTVSVWLLLSIADDRRSSSSASLYARQLTEFRFTSPPFVRPRVQEIFMRPCL